MLVHIEYGNSKIYYELLEASIFKFRIPWNLKLTALILSEEVHFLTTLIYDVIVHVYWFVYNMFFEQLSQDEHSARHAVAQ